MDKEELTPHIEELKKALNDKIDGSQLEKELDTYLNTYHVSMDAAKRGIMRKYGVGDASSFVTADSISKKIGDLKGTEMNIDIVAKAIYVDKKDITVRGNRKTIISGILGDETGTAPFTIWEGESAELIKGEVYTFKNAYTKKWNERVQINLGSRGKVESADNVKIDVTDRTIVTEASELDIGNIKDGVGNVTVTGRIMSVDAKNVMVKNEEKVVYSGIIADDSGKIQFSAWNDFNLKTGETIRAKNAYVRSWRGIPQLNLGDKCEVSRVDDSFDNISDGVAKKTVADIFDIGGGLDMSITGTVVDLRIGSGLIKRCPECNRSILTDECVTHGHVEPVLDLRMKLTLDDGTGAISAIVNRQDTEKITGITLDAAKGLAKAHGNPDIVASEMTQLVIMKRLTVVGNVMSDDYGPMMIVRSAETDEVDVISEAEKLYEEVEGAL